MVGGEGWIRTSVRLRGQIYSLLPLTTRPPLQVGPARSASRNSRPTPIIVRTIIGRGQWRAAAMLSTGGGLRGSPVAGAPALQTKACPRQVRSPPRWRSVRSKPRPAPGRSCFGAGEGNRTLVISLEGFCSTIELHPHFNHLAGPAAERLAGSGVAREPMAHPRAAGQRLPRPEASTFGLALGQFIR